MKKGIMEYLEQKFMTPDKFALEIELLVNEHTPYIDAICHYCSEADIDIESVSYLIVDELKEKLEAEARKLHFLKGKRGRLF